MDALVRHGLLGEVSMLGMESGLEIRRGEPVVVRTHRGLQLGRVLDIRIETSTDSAQRETIVVRKATVEDQHLDEFLRQAAEAEFPRWRERIDQWGLDLQLIDAEWTLDRTKLILYVLNDRGSDCTRLALHAAASGLGVVEVQPVSSEGPLTLQDGGGCGSCGCH